jgi:hypothetical protein
MKRLVVMIAMCGSLSAQAQGVRTGMPFLKSGAGADGVGMGDAAVATASGANAMFYNPAGLAAAARPMVMMMHNESVQDVRLEVLGATIPAGRWALGISLQANTVADVPIRTSASVEPEGMFTAIEAALGIGAAYQVDDALSVGGTLKALIQKIYTSEAIGGAMDLGARYRLSGVPITIGLSLQNLGAMGVLENESTRLPATVRAGASYDGEFGEASTFAFLAAAGVDITIHDDLVHLRLGGEVTYNHVITLRSGLHTGYDASLVTGGLGFRYKVLRFDYALTPYAQSYGTGHSFSLAVDL